MARNFNTVFSEIRRVAPEALREALDKSVGFWAPENRWQNLSMYVNKYVEPSSTNKTSIKVYSILCDCTEEEMKKRFQKDGL